MANNAIKKNGEYPSTRKTQNVQTFGSCCADIPYWQSAVERGRSTRRVEICWQFPRTNPVKLQNLVRRNKKPRKRILPNKKRSNERTHNNPYCSPRYEKNIMLSFLSRFNISVSFSFRRGGLETRRAKWTISSVTLSPLYTKWLSSPL